MRLWILLIIFLAPCEAQETRSIRPEPSPSRKALIMANLNYKQRPLANTFNDGDDVAAVLRSIGFSVDVARDLSRREMQTKAMDFAHSLRPGDIAWLYYSGHGFQLDGENYLVPVEFAAATADEARERAVAFSPIKSELEKSAARLSIMVLDACRDTPFDSSASPFQGMAPQEAALGAYLAFAASPGQVAFERPNERNSLFTGHLVEALRRPLSISDLFREVRRKVYESSGGKQLPYIHDQAIADFYIRSPPGPGRGNEVSGALTAIDDLYEQGKRLYHSGRCNDALEKLDAVARSRPQDAFVQNALGLTYRCLGLPSLAAERFSRAIDLKPAYAGAYRNRGEVFSEQAQFELAIDDFNWALEQEAADASLYWRRGRAKFGLLHYEDAARDFTTAIDRDPTSSDGHYWQGRVLYELGKYREALLAFEAAIARKRNFADAIDYRARVAEKLSRR